MPKRSPAGSTSLEAQLTDITLEFVARIVSTLRNASFAEVAGIDVNASLRRAKVAPPPASVRRVRRTKQELTDSGTGAPVPSTKQGRRGRRPRQTQEKRGELAERIIGALASAGSPLGVRALASELATAPDLLAIPLRDLRQQGKIRKLGEKRNTTYSL